MSDLVGRVCALRAGRLALIVGADKFIEDYGGADAWVYAALDEGDLIQVYEDEIDWDATAAFEQIYPDEPHN